MGRVFLIIGCLFAAILIADSVMHDPDVHPLVERVINRVDHRIELLQTRFSSPTKAEETDKSCQQVDRTWRELIVELPKRDAAIGNVFTASDDDLSLLVIVQDVTPTGRIRTVDVLASLPVTGLFVRIGDDSTFVEIDPDTTSVSSVRTERKSPFQELAICYAAIRFGEEIDATPGEIEGPTAMASPDTVRPDAPTATIVPAATLTTIPVVTLTIAATETGTAVPTATETAVPTATKTTVPTATEAAVPTATKTTVPTATETAVPTETETAVPTETETAVPTETETVLPTETETAIPTVTETAIPTETETAVPTPTETAVPTETETAVPTATETAVPTATETAVLTETETAVPTATETAVPTATETAVPTATETAVPTATETVVPTATETAVPTETETAVPTATETAVPTATETAVPTATETAVPTETETAVPTATEMAVPTETEPEVPTESETAIPTATGTAAPNETETAAPTQTSTSSDVPTSETDSSPDFTQASPEQTATETANPTSTPLFEVSGNGAFEDWDLPEGWTSDGLLATDGQADEVDWVAPPITVPGSPDYGVEITIVLGETGKCPRSFGIAIRGSSTGYLAGGIEWNCDAAATIWNGQQQLDSARIEMLPGPHTVLVQAIGSKVTLTLDGVVVSEITTDEVPNGEQIAFWSAGVPITISSVRVVDLSDTEGGSNDT